VALFNDRRDCEQGFPRQERIMKILVTGASGLVGSALVPFLTARGHQVTRLVRTSPGKEEPDIFWDPAAGRLDAASLPGFDAVVHLAGESIAQRWTGAAMRRILDSRVSGTRTLARALAELERPPQAVVCASAVGYYGHRGDEVLTEESSPGSGFLADVCRQWEQAATAVTEKGTRLVLLRIGMILSAAGGALPRMLPPFRLGAGGKLGSGGQYVSWITLDDLLEIILLAVASPTLYGPVNAVAPNPVTNLEFTRTLGRVLRRFTFASVPAFAVRLMLGKMGEEVLLASARVKPAQLVTAGFPFRYPELEPALRRALGRD
jgi:hypothetical protein